jgi:hypothetical protein
MLNETTARSTMVTSVVIAEPKYVMNVGLKGPAMRKTTSRAK